MAPATRYVDQRQVYPVTRPSTRGVRGAVMRKRGTPGSPKDSANSNIKRDPRPASNGSRSRCPLASCPTPAAFARPAPPCLRRPVKLGAVHHPPPTPGREEVPNCHPFLPAAVANWRPELAVDAVSRRRGRWDAFGALHRRTRFHPVHQPQSREASQPAGMKNHHCTRTRARCGQPPVSAGQTPHKLDLGGLLDPQVTPRPNRGHYFAPCPP